MIRSTSARLRLARFAVPAVAACAAVALAVPASAAYVKSPAVRRWMFWERET